jgi:DNA-binding CsgD family transcriptional regulator
MLRWDAHDTRFTIEEFKVVRLVTLGYTDKEIGRDLFMSEWTVRYHLRKVFQRFKIRRRIELVGLLAGQTRPDSEPDARKVEF